MHYFGFHSEYYIPANEKLAFNFPHAYILGRNNVLGKQHEMFVSWHNKFDCKCRHDYSEIC